MILPPEDKPGSLGPAQGTAPPCPGTKDKPRTNPFPTLRKTGFTRQNQKPCPGHILPQAEQRLIPGQKSPGNTPGKNKTHKGKSL